MRIRHKLSKEKPKMSISLEHWHNEYSKGRKYLNYEFSDVPPIVDLYQIDPKTGNKTFLRSTFEGAAKQITSKEPYKYVYLPVADGRLDEYLMPKNQFSRIPFFLGSKNALKSVPLPKIIHVKSIISTTSKLIVNNAIGVFIGVLILMIWFKYQFELVNLWDRFIE